MVPCNAVSTSAAPSAPSVTDARRVTPRSRHGSSQPSTDSTWAVGTFPARATRSAPPTRPLFHSLATVGTTRGGWALWHQVRGPHKIERLPTDDVQVASSICARKDGEGGLKTTAMTSCRAARLNPRRIPPPRDPPPPYTQPHTPTTTLHATSNACAQPHTHVTTIIDARITCPTGRAQVLTHYHRWCLL